MASTGASYGSSRNYISEQELSECDRQEIHKIGAIQGNSGHLLFWKHPSNEIIAYDEKVRDVEFIKHVTNLDIAPMGTRINEWMPMDLLEETERMVEEMEQALSTRSFHFYTFNNRSYSISVSTTTSDLSVLSMEIEETPADQVSA